MVIRDDPETLPIVRRIIPDGNPFIYVDTNRQAPPIHTHTYK